MKPRTFTQSMSWLHTWAGLLLGWALYAIFLTGSLAVSYQDVYASAGNPNPKFMRTTWFGVLYGPDNLAPLGVASFEGFANSGMLMNSPANSWALQDNVPMSGFRRDASGRLVLRGTSGQLITWSPEDGLQTFVQR